MPTDVPDSSLPLPRVSVVLPVYNHAAYVRAALDSVRAQTWSDWELIVIDDGSTDDSLGVLRRYVDEVRDPRIQLHSQANAGSHATINRGLGMARAPYLAILNSDDCFAATRLERLLTLAHQHPGPLLAVTGVRLIDGHGAEVGAGHPMSWWQSMYDDMLVRWRQARTDSRHAVRDTLLWGNFTVSTSNFFFSRELVEQLGLLKRYRYVLDWEYALRVAIECPQAFHFLDDEPLLDYRMHGHNTILGGAIRNHVEAAWVLRRAHKRLARLGEPVSVPAIERLRYLDRFVRQQRVREAESGRALTQRKLDLTQAHVDKLDILVLQQQRELEDLHAELLAEQMHTARLEAGMAELKASTSWRVTAPLRWTGGTVRRLAARAKNRTATPEESTAKGYQAWLLAEDQHVEALRAQAPAWLQALEQPLLLSLLVPVHNTDPVMLEAMLKSVQAQIYPHWELCLCDDASTSEPTRALLAQWAQADERIRVHRREHNGHIAQATNDALALARGDFVALLDHDDELAPHALLRVAQTLQADPAIDLLYSDEDKLDEQGQRCLPYFKPDWSPTLLWAQNYIGHLMCVRRNLLLDCGGMQLGMEGSQDHDLVLRLVAQGARMHHLPEVLYHWRMHAGSTASNAQSKPYAHVAGQEAVGHFLRGRYGDQFKRVEDSPYLFVYEPRFRVPQGCMVSIIIPTKDKVELLQPCIDSIRNLSSWPHFEILVLDNNSSEPRTAQYLQEIVALDSRVRVIDAPIAFNWSKLNNIGRREARGEVLVFLNNDTLVITPDWLERLMEMALLPDVATVGPMLLFEDGSIQHAGVVVGMGGWADHVYRTAQPDNIPSPYVANVVARNVLANTGACVAIARERFDALGGFDESFEICGSDVELGIRAHKRGLLNVYQPAVRLYHLESKTRSPHVPEVDFIQSDLKYAPYRLHGDPFYNPNLDPGSTRPVPRHPTSR